MNHFEEAIVAAREVLSFYGQLYTTFDLLNFRSDIILTSILIRERIVVDLLPFINKFCGMLTIDEHETSILLNKNHLPVKRFFTTGHELCHYFMHSNESSYFLDHHGHLNTQSDKNPIMEQQANTFASELLMPREVINSMLSNKYSFYRIAKSIKVSYESLKWRLVRHCIEIYGLNHQESLLIVEEFIYLSKTKQHHKAAIFEIELSSTIKVLSSLVYKNKYKERSVYF